MSTAALIGKAVYTGTNGSNGNVATGVALYPSYSVSSSIGVANLTNPGVSSVTSIATYTGTNGSNGNVVVGRLPSGSLGTQGPAASPATPPTYNPGS